MLSQLRALLHRSCQEWTDDEIACLLDPTRGPEALGMLDDRCARVGMSEREWRELTQWVLDWHGLSASDIDCQSDDAK